MAYRRIAVDFALSPMVLSPEDRDGLVATVEDAVGRAVEHIVATGQAVFVGRPEVLNVPGAGVHLVQISMEVRAASRAEDIMVPMGKGAVYQDARGVAEPELPVGPRPEASTARGGRGRLMTRRRRPLLSLTVDRCSS